MIINRAEDLSGNITSVQDRYGRMVFYHVGNYHNIGVPAQIRQVNQELDTVSQPVQGFPSQTPPLRYSYGYVMVSTQENDYETVPALGSISVPSPTGTGIATATIAYTADGYVDHITDANGNEHQYTFVPDATGSGANGEEVSVTGPNMPSAYNYTVTYDNNMDELTRTDGGNSVIPETKVYGDASNPYVPTQVTDGNGKVRQYTYDPSGNGNLLEEDSRFTGTPGASGTNYLAQVYTYSYENFGLGELTETQEKYMLTGSGGGASVVSEKSPTTYAYFEPSGNLETETRPAPGSVNSSATVAYSFAYDILGDITQMTTPGNNAASSITTTYDYGSSPSIGEALTVTDALGHAQTFTYDALGNKTSMTDALGYETDYSYVDPNAANGGVNVGQLNATEYPPTTSVTTNRAIMKETYLYPGGPKLSDKTYDESGNLYRETDYAYGAEGEGLSVSGSTEPVSYTYDALYRIATLTDGNNNVTHYYYNAQGYLNAMTYPGYAGSAPSYDSSSGMWTNISGGDSLVYASYDAVGDVTSRVDGRGVTTTYTYSDPANLLTNVHYTLPTTVPVGLVGTPDVNFTYDDFGRTSTVDNGVVRTTYGTNGTGGYDDDDNPLTVQTGYYNDADTSILFSRSISYAYYANNSRETMTVPTGDGTTTGTFTYGYDAAGRPTSLVNPFGETTAWSYLNNNWLASQADYNASSALVCTASYAYDARGFMTDLANTDRSGNTLSEFGSTNPTYAMMYDAMGNRTMMAVNEPVATGYSGTTDYSYDSRNELTQEASTRNSGYTNNFAYDGAENPTTFRSVSVPAANSDNQIAVSGQYEYDGSGNPTIYKGESLIFDPENRMTAYGTAETNGYTADGLRAWKQGSSRTYYLYDKSSAICEFDSNGSITATNTIGSDGLVSRNSSNASTFYTFDAQDSTSQRLSNSSTVLTSGMSDGPGSPTDGTSVDPFSGYSAKWGYYSDNETGLLLLMHRYYDPLNGRFITRDPESYFGGIDLYSYVHNNTINNIDPLGFWCQSKFDDCMHLALSTALAACILAITYTIALCILACIGPQFIVCIVAGWAACLVMAAVACAQAFAASIALGTLACIIYALTSSCPSSPRLVCKFNFRG